VNTQQGDAHNLKQPLPVAVSAGAVGVSRRVRRRTTMAMVVAAVAAAMLVPGGQAAQQREPVSGDAFIPFVTDFPKGVVSETNAEPFIPFVTDFPKPARAPVQAADPTVASATGSPASYASASEIDWGHVGIGSGVGAGLAVMLAGSWLVLVRRTKPARS